ncbi:MAG: hypothetical protein F6J95_026270 [Leptolyngbya sp. SIO1E4]|nr:hypothetical protein [Leptolyngbya sp. SIO1E4]
MQVQDKINNFKKRVLREEGPTLSISSDELDALNQEYHAVYSAILSGLSFLEKNWLGFIHYKISVDYITEIFDIQPIWIFPFLSVKMSRDLSFYKDNNNNWYEGYTLRSVSCMQVPKGGLFDESLKVTGGSDGFIEFLLGSSKLKGSTFELCRRGVDYMSILERNSEEKRFIKRITSRIKNIEIKDGRIIIDT